MKIWLGLQLDVASCLPRREDSTIGEHFFTPRAFVQWLEAYYGLQYPTGNIDYLRSEQYRQLCLAQLDQHPNLFYAKAFKADQRAAAEELLSRRDELISAGYPLAKDIEGTPSRIEALSAIERMILDPDNRLDLLTGFADRIHQLTIALTERKHPQLDIQLHEPLEWLPPGLVRLLKALEASGAKIQQIAEPILKTSTTDLDNWRNKIDGQTKDALDANGDGSLIVLKAHRETHLAAFLAKMLAQNPSWRPNLLLSDRSSTLNTALTLEGLPDIGLALSSFGRPSLQVLKLVTSFLWTPIDLNKVLEFLNLIVKPFDNHFAQQLANSLSDTPGLHGPAWNQAVARYLNDTLPKRAKYDKKLDDKIKEQYNFWFSRQRYRQDELIPKAEVRSIFTFLLNWSRDEQVNLKGADLVVRQLLATQCKKLVDLIDTLPEGDLSYLETERLVRTIYEPIPTVFRPAEQGHLMTAYHPASVYAAQDELIWWNFTEQDSGYFFSRWTKQELCYFASQNIHLLSPKQKSDRLNWQQLRPVLHTQKRLLLCVSKYVEGDDALPHPLIGDLEAAFGDSINKLIVDVDQFSENSSLLADFQQPFYHEEPLNPLPSARKGIEVDTAYSSYLEREYETPSSLDKLLYYPHQYVFQDGLGLRANKLLSISSDTRLLGNLGHRMIEEMLNTRGEDIWERQQTYTFVDTYMPKLLQQEGAPLLAYGSEPERVKLQQTLGQACWSLLSLIQQNNWKFKGSEVKLEGKLQDQTFRGRADLLLERGTELAIIDLKWRGKTTFRNLIKNQEDLQLSLYATSEVAKSYDVVHTAYFIISNGLMISRNDLAFKDIDAVSPTEDHIAMRDAVIDKIKATYDWRKEQLATGWLETRMEKTAGALEDHYQDDLDLLGLLEMKDEDARWDDYWTLIGLLE